MYSLKRLVRLFALYASWVVPAGAVQGPRYLDTQLSQYIRNEPAAVPAVLHTYTFGLIDLTKLNPFLGSTDLVNLVSGAACDTATNDSICRDRPGLGSGLEFAPESQVFFSHTDRGPNQDCKEYFPATKQTGVNFPVPRFSPSFVSFKLENGRVRMLTTNHLRKTNGDPVSGRSNTSNDEKNFVNKCTGEIGDSRDGIDWEDMRRFPDGVHFMGSEEYSPSVFIFDATGRILKRYVPIGQTLVRTETAGYPVKELLPPVVARRRPNRGFENLALTKDGSRAYAVLQSPMGNATLPEFAKNRMIRVVELDVSQPTKAKYIGMYAFLMSDPAEYKRQKTSYKDVKLGSAAHLTKKTLLILEQGNGGKKLYTVDLSKASNLKGRFDDSLKPESAASDLRRMQVELGTVKIVLDTDAMPVIDSDLFAKQEGLTVLAPSTVAMITDNDFGLGNGKPTQIRFLHLTSKLPGIQNVFAASTDHSGPRKPQCDYRHCVGDKCYTVLGKASHSSASAACRIMGAVLIDQQFAKTLQSSSRLKKLLSVTLDWAWEEDEDKFDDKGYAWLAGSQSDQGDMCPVAVHEHGSSEVRTEWKRCAAGSKYASLCEVARPSECK